MGRVHHCIEHVGHAHRLPDEIEKAEDHCQADDARVAAYRFLAAEGGEKSGRMFSKRHKVILLMLG